MQTYQKKNLFSSKIPTRRSHRLLYQPALTFNHNLKVIASLIAQLVKNLPATQETLVQFLGWDDLLEKGQATQYSWASLLAQLVKNPLAMQESWVQSLGREGPLEKGKATHSSILACTVHGVTKSWTRLSDFHFLKVISFNVLVFY